MRLVLMLWERFPRHTTNQTKIMQNDIQQLSWEREPGKSDKLVVAFTLEGVPCKEGYRPQLSDCDVLERIQQFAQELAEEMTFDNESGDDDGDDPQVVANEANAFTKWVD